MQSKSAIRDPKSAILPLFLLFRLSRTRLPESGPGPRAGTRAGALGGDLAEAGEVVGLHLGRGGVLASDGVARLLRLDPDLLGGGDPQTHLVAADVYQGDLDVVPDHDRLIALSRQHQHRRLLPGKGEASRGPFDDRTGSPRESRTT